MDLLTVAMLVVITVVVVTIITVQLRRNKRQANMPYVAPPTPSPPSGKTNTLAIVAFVLSFFLSVPAIVIAHVSLSQIHKTNDAGRGFAEAALWIGYLSLGLLVVAVVAIPYYLSAGNL